jgi:xanthine dehydrogenase YagS FAD-binding subunit
MKKDEKKHGEQQETDDAKERYAALAQAAADVASPRLRNQGTVGGNLCQKPRCWHYRGEFKCLR